MMTKHLFLMLVLVMTSKRFLFSLFLLVVFFGTPLFAEFSEKTVTASEKTISKIFKKSTILRNSSTNEQLINSGLYHKTIFYTIKQSDEIAGYALLTRVPSKSHALDLLLITDSKASIISIKLTGLKGSKNAPLKSPFWNKQFIGASIENKKLDEVDAISGATISSEAVISGVKHSLDFIRSKCK